MKRNESWLLAKNLWMDFYVLHVKVRDLNNKSDYVAWNKYLQRDDKTYRNGFSRMLQNVNSNLLQSQEMKDKNFISYDEINDLNIFKMKEIKMLFYLLFLIKKILILLIIIILVILITSNC